MSSLNVVRVTSKDFGAYARRVAAVYVRCFSEEPWSEVFEADEVAGDMDRKLALSDSILLVAEEGYSVLGATLLYPLQFNQAVAQIVPLAGAMYCEELFVSSSHHRRGIGGRLFDTATGISMAMGYERRVLRTAVDHERAKRFYINRGYRPVGAMQCRSLKRVGGAVQEARDSRVVMVQESSPPVPPIPPS